jgi:hypothetical protein
VIKSRRAEVYTVFWRGNLMERDNLGDPGVDGRIILQWIFRKWNMKAWTGSSWLRDRWRTLVSEVMNIRVP